MNAFCVPRSVDDENEGSEEHLSTKYFGGKNGVERLCVLYYSFNPMHVISTFNCQICMDQLHRLSVNLETVLIDTPISLKYAK